jgi:transcriptional regulator with XRE-family HTH domain
MTQSDLARRIGVQRSAVTQWEREGGTSPSVGHLVQIACETGVCFEWLATGRGPSRLDSEIAEADLVLGDFARDEFETRVLVSLRRVAARKKEAVAKLIEILAG